MPPLTNLLALLLLPVISTALSCLDADGAPVEWWLTIKHHAGLRYSYTDALSPPGPLRLAPSPRTLNDTDSPVGFTLTQLIAARNTTVRVNWNDASSMDMRVLAAAAGGETTWPVWRDVHTARVESGTNGHTNGVLGASTSGGFWITHSWPHFPTLSGDAYSVPPPIAPQYGQQILCVSLDAGNLNTLAASLQQIDLDAHDSVVPSGELSTLYPNIVALLAGQRVSGSAETTITSVGGSQWRFFSKSGDWGKDIFEDLIQPALGVDLRVETWRRSPQMQTYCPPTYPWASRNVETLAVEDSDGTLLPFKYTVDHCKFAVTDPAANTQRQAMQAPPLAAGNVSWACIADNNRMTSQWARGGGSVCTTNSVIYTALASLIQTVDDCPATNMLEH